MKKLLKGLAAIVLFACVAFALPLGLNANAADNTNAYKYNLAFEDNFDGSVKEDWSIYGGTNSTKKDGVTSWNLKGENHIVYKPNGGTTTDYGKFLYGESTSTNYMFEVKVRADVDKALADYVIGTDAVTINSHIPFFATSTSATNAFTGRSICFNNYAIGFWEYGSVNGWRGSKRITLTTLADTFDWRDWHTIRVEATTTQCKLWLDDLLMVTSAQSVFTGGSPTAGPCGFSAVCGAGLVSLHYDDFRVWTTNSSYDSTVTEVEKTVQGINAADFRDSTKVTYGASAFSTALEETTENKLLYNLDEYKMGTDHRVLKDYSYTSLNAVVGMDIERQKAAKGVVAGEDYTGTTRISTSNLTGILFNGSFTSGKYNGYQLCYYAIYYQSTFQNVVNLYLNKLTNSAIANSSTDQILIGKLTGTTSCVVDMNVEGGYLTVTPYATKADYQSGTKATLTSSASSVTVTDGAYKVKLPTYDATVGGDYTEGNFGFRCQSGSTSATNHLQLMCDVEFLSFSGKTTAAPDTTEPVVNTRTQTVSVTSTANGSVTVDGYAPVTLNGAVTSKAQTVKTGSEVALTFAPASGYQIKNVNINGYDHGAITSWNISNITSAYEVDVTFSKKYQVTFKNTLGETLSSTSVWEGENTFKIADFGAQAVGFVTDDGVYATWTGEVTAATDVTVLIADIALTEGASVRFATPSGLRFQSNVSVDTYTHLASLNPTYGILMLTEEKRGTAELTLSSANVLNFTVAPALNGDVYQYRAAVANIPAAKYETAVAARGYLTVTLSDGTTRTVYTAFDAEKNVRSISEVAQNILDDPELSAEYAAYTELLESYANYTVKSLSFTAASVATTNVGGYPRMVKLTNGKYLLTADTRYAFSDDGKSFGTYSKLPISANEPTDTEALACGNAQPLVLSDGRVAIAYRAQLVSTYGYASIRMIISTDATCTAFSEPVVIAEVYTRDKNTGGMWEPYLVQKGDTLLVYFSCDAQTSVEKNGVAANTAYVCEGGFQNVLVTSYELSSGTVGATSVVCDGETTETRPGMSVITTLADGSYAMVVEYWKGENCEIDILYSKDGLAWTAPAKLISLSGGICAAPYIVTLPTGQIALTFQSPADYEGDFADESNTKKAQLKFYISENDVSYGSTVTLKESSTGIALDKNDYLIWNGMAVIDNVLYVFGGKGTVTAAGTYAAGGLQIVYAKIYG